MNIEAVRSLLLALDVGSLSAAAGRLGVPPSTVSRRVREVESDVGRPILLRNGRGVRLEASATDTVARLRDVLHAVDACYAETKPLTRLRVTATLDMANALLPGLLPSFREAFPDVVVEVRGDDRVLGLVEGEFDLALRAGALEDSSFLSRALLPGPFRVVVAPRMAERIRSVDQLAATPTVEIAGPPPGLVGRWRGAPFRVRSPAAARVDTFTAALPLVVAGHAYAAMPSHVAREHLREGTLVALADAVLDPVPLHALYPRRHRDQPAVRALVDAVAIALGEGGG